jgi:hypothetical protein
MLNGAVTCPVVDLVMEAPGRGGPGGAVVARD